MSLCKRQTQQMVLYLVPRLTLRIPADNCFGDYCRKPIVRCAGSREKTDTKSSQNNFKKLLTGGYNRKI